MSASNKSGSSLPPSCRRCRGCGWKYVGGRAAGARSVSDGRAPVRQKRRCLDCDGTGRERS